MRFIKILLLCLLLPMAALLAAVPPDTVGIDTLSEDKETLREAAFYYLHHEDYTQARRYARRLLEVGERQNDRANAQLYGHLICGLSLIESGTDTWCYEHLETARSLAERYQNHEALMLVLNGFGNYALFDNDDVYMAISYYFQALEEAKRTGNRRQYAMILSNISGAYFMRRDPSGLMYAEEAVRIARETKEPVPLFYGTVNSALYYLAADSLEPASITIEAIRQMHATQGFGTESDVCLLQAMLHAKRGENAEAYNDYARAMENFPTAAASTITMVYLEYAKLLRADHHLDSAVRVLEHALSHISTSGVPIHKTRLLKELALCYREAGLTEKALQCTLEYMDYQDCLFDEVRERATQEARIKHDIYSREQRISEQQMVILDNRYRIALLSGVLIAVLLALGLTYFFYRKKNRLYNAIVSQNNEYMHREQTLLAQLEKLRQGGQPASPVPADKLKDLMARFTAEMLEQKLFTDPSLTITAVAERLGTNRTYLSKAINDITGKTFTQLVNEYRIRQAIAEISDLKADKPLKQISTDVGFNSLSTFYNTFQASTGMTPARYRSQLKGL